MSLCFRERVIARPCGQWLTVCALALLVVPLAVGCASSGFVALRAKPRNPLADVLQITSYQGPQHTERTLQILRRYDLVDDLKREPRELLQKASTQLATEPSADGVYALGEIAYINGRKAQERKQDALALDLYGVAVAQAYMYLFDPRYDIARNPYDPQFRRACDLYNSALEGALRIVRDKGKLLPGSTYTAKSCGQQFDVQIVARGRWRPDEIEKLEFASDYDVKNLATTYRTFGLGVPLIAVRKPGPPGDPAERYLPPGVSFATTAFLRVNPCAANMLGKANAKPSTSTKEEEMPVRQCTLELFDTVTTSDILVNNRLAPLEADLTTPLAYYLNSPLLQSTDLATWGLLFPETSLRVKGLYMLEPYDPKKIPVLMVHGLWSSPFTWVEMFNDLRSVPEIRNNFQFWFYLYPSGQPFWQSAAQLRGDLATVRGMLDPERQATALDHMVLVGHSMGGLVSRMQTIESGNSIWSLVSERPFEELKAPAEMKEKLQREFFFHANPDVRRVISVATPFAGSDFANDTTRYLSSKLITLPASMMQLNSLTLMQQNPSGFFKGTDLLMTNTSIDSLDPSSPVFKALDQAEKSQRVTYHNILALVPNAGLVGRWAAGSDGVVTFASAHREDVVSEKQVTSDHVNVHRTPGAVQEVRRILREHLNAAIHEWRVTHGEPIPQQYQVLPAAKIEN